MIHLIYQAMIIFINIDIFVFFFWPEELNLMMLLLLYEN